MTRYIVIVLAVVLLLGGGYWLYSSRMSALEAELREAASSLPAQSRHGIEVTVDGRNVILTGPAHDEEEAARLVALAEALPGQGSVVDNMALLPSLSPYLFEARKAFGGGLEGLSGAVPDRADAEKLVAAFPDADMSGLFLASGAPETGWADVMVTALKALDTVTSGTLRIEDRTVSIWGEVETTAARDAISAAAAQTPDYDWALNIDVTRPVISSYEFRAENADGVVRAWGPVPTPDAARRLTDLIGTAGGQARDQAGQRLRVGAGAPEGWVPAVLAGVEALMSLESGTLELAPGVLELSGIAADDEKLLAAEALLMPIAGEGAYEVVISVRLNAP